MDVLKFIAVYTSQPPDIHNQFARAVSVEAGRPLNGEPPESFLAFISSFFFLQKGKQTLSIVNYL